MAGSRLRFDLFQDTLWPYAPNPANYAGSFLRKLTAADGAAWTGLFDATAGDQGFSTLNFGAVSRAGAPALVVDWNPAGDAVTIASRLAWNDIKNVVVDDFTGRSLTVQNLVDALIDLRTNTSGQSVAVDGAKRAKIDLGSGDDTLFIGADSNRGGTGNDFHLNTGAGDDLVTITRSTIDYSITAFRFAYVEGWTNSFVQLGEGNDTIVADGSNDSVWGGAGDDRAELRGGTNSFDGGAGFDTAVFRGLRGDYRIEALADGLRITDLNPVADGNDGVTTVTAVERLQFRDVYINTANRAPDAVNDSATATLGGATVALADLLANDSDADNDTLSLQGFGTAANGVVVFGGGSFVYTANAGFSGSDSFTYTISDGQGGTATATVTITVPGGGGNRAPVAVADSFSVQEGRVLSIAGPGLLANDSDADNDPIIAAQFDSTSAQGGTVTMVTDGSFTYTPPVGFAGTDSFTYRIFDGVAYSGDATVTITVVEGTPVAVADAFTVTAGQTTTIAAPGLLANDSDPNNDPIIAAQFDSTSAQGGTVTMVTDGSFTYTPAAGFAGTDSFTYRIFDGVLYSDTATVTLTVRSPGVLDAVNDSYLVSGGELITDVGTGVLANDTNAPGIGFSVVGFTYTGTGQLFVIDTGAFVYTAAPGFFGTDTFSYTVRDAFGAEDTATVTLNVPPATADLSLTLVRLGSGEVAVGGAAQFQVTVTNSGPGTSGGTVRLDPGTLGAVTAATGGLAPPDFDFGTDTWTFAPLGSGESASIVVTVDFGAFGNDSVLAEIMTAGLPDPDSTPGNFNSDPAVEDDVGIAAITVRPLAADLSLTLVRVGGGEIAVGGAAEFLLTVTNSGPDASGGTVRVDPGTLGAVTAATGGLAPPDFDFGTDTWTFAPLGSGESASIVVTVDFGAFGNGTVLAEIMTADLTDADSTPGNFNSDPAVEDDVASAAITVRRLEADLSVSVAVGTPQVAVGGSSTLVFTIINSGPDAGGGVFGLYTLDGSVPAGPVLVSAGSYDAASGAWTLPELASGQAVTLTATYAFAEFQQGTNAIIGEIVSTTRPDPDSTPGNFNTDPAAEDDVAVGVVTVRQPGMPQGQVFYFSGSVPGQGRELWVYDPASNSPALGGPFATMVTDAEMMPGPRGTHPTGITALGDTVFWRDLREFPLPEDVEVANTSWYFYNPALGPGVWFQTVDEYAFDAHLPVEERTLGVRSGELFWYAIGVPGVGGGPSGLIGARDAAGVEVGAAWMQGADRHLLTDANGAPAYAALAETYDPDTESLLDAEQLFVVLREPSGGFWTTVRATDGGDAGNDIRDIAGLTELADPLNPGARVKTMYFAGDHADDAGTFHAGALWTLTLENGGSGWTSSALPTRIVGFDAVHTLAVSAVPTDGVNGLAPQEYVFFFATLASGDSVIGAHITDVFGTFQPGGASSFSLHDGDSFAGFEIKPWEDGVIFSGRADSGASTFVATWTDADGNGAFEMTTVFDAAAGTIEHLVVDGAGNAAWVLDDGSQDTLYKFVNGTVESLIIRTGEIDALQMADGHLVSRQGSLANSGVPTLFDHNYGVVSPYGIEVPTDEITGTGGTGDGFASGYRNVAIPNALVFEANLGNTSGWRIFATDGSIVTNTQVIANSEGAVLDGDAVYSGYRIDTAENGLFRVSASGAVTTLTTASANFSNEAEVLGQKVLTGFFGNPFPPPGTAANQVLVYDDTTGSTSILIDNALLGAAETVGGGIIFNALDFSRAINSDGDALNDVWTLYRYDGTTLSTLTDLPTGGGGGQHVSEWWRHQDFLGDDSRIFWKQANDAFGVEVHTIDLTAANPAGTLAVIDIDPGAASGANFADAVFAQGRLYFQASPTGLSDDMRLYTTTDGTDVTQVTGPDLFDPGYQFPYLPVTIGSEVFFLGRKTGAGNFGVFQVNDDGVTATLITPLPFFSTYALAAIGNDLVFAAFDPVTNTDQLWSVTPGAAPVQATPTMLTSFPGIDGAGSMDDIFLADGKIFFGRSEPDLGRELWVLDATATDGARFVADLNLEAAPGDGYAPEQVVATPNPLEALLAAMATGNGGGILA